MVILWSGAAWETKTLVPCTGWRWQQEAPRCPYRPVHVPSDPTTVKLLFMALALTRFCFAGNFKSGCRFTFNIYGCRENGHELLEIQSGYIQELRECWNRRFTPVDSFTLCKMCPFFQNLLLRICRGSESGWLYQRVLIRDPGVALQRGQSGPSGVHHWLLSYGGRSTAGHAGRWCECKAANVALVIGSSNTGVVLE